MPQCIIMGCVLQLEVEPRSVWGDLHKEGDCYIFNACLQDGETAWVYAESPEDQSQRRVITIKAFRPYFERRGVIVVLQSNCRLNEKAKNYVHGH